MLENNKAPGHIVAIVGAGLSGLVLANLLHQINIEVTVYEAAARTGGRIHTVMGAEGTPLELGATWFSEVHPMLSELAAAMGLFSFSQYSKGKSIYHTKAFMPVQEFSLPDMSPPSFRFEGGTARLIEKLAQRLPSSAIRTETKITAVRDQSEGILLTDSFGNRYSAKYAAVCVPPKLAASTIEYTPDLPSELSSLMKSTHTFMSGSTKFVLEYKEPFWRNTGYSGLVCAHTGLITEMYDHSDVSAEKYGFMGFLGPLAPNYTKQQRQDAVLAQLVSFFGEQARYPLFYEDKTWADEFITGHLLTKEFLHQNNGNPVMQKAYMNGKLFFSASETSAIHPGYLEGAIAAASRTASKIMDSVGLTQILTGFHGMN